MKAFQKNSTKSIFLNNIYGGKAIKFNEVFSIKNHPEWRTKSAISKWLIKSRMSDERVFG